MIGTLRTVAFDAPDITRLATFYSALAGWTEHAVEDDWITMLSGEGYRIAFQLAPDHVAPRWPDPAHPQQAHLDLRVPDIDAAADRAVELGATRLGGGATWHTLADPAGHPFDLCHNDDDPPMSVYAVTIDAADPSNLARFYADLLGMEVRYDGPEGALIGADGQLPVMIQRVEHQVAPRWPDPAYPQQVHLDVLVDDVSVAEPAAIDLGASRLDGEGGNWRVYADPAGHPFCLTWTV